ncbi:uncharacterized protein BDZ99DRAFT_568940 [Mytilinidion resinicola]|uniref:Uncharacterized protein n=1 Tax=Mytilinidion resinicola TaxID=574789 RepID=A0A6A6YW57_9PEZI|nr:uncharacterized protein BDZ99DRAFT_568940 [Mytilinidion resinicola]KAF2812224.1 hypothetical protein BDZ99DRAFT_568940 [Mytilinidion resinicola]
MSKLFIGSLAWHTDDATLRTKLDEAVVGVMDGSRPASPVQQEDRGSLGGPQEQGKSSPTVPQGGRSVLNTSRNWPGGVD